MDANSQVTLLDPDEIRRRLEADSGLNSRLVGILMTQLGEGCPREIIIEQVMLRIVGVFARYEDGLEGTAFRSAQMYLESKIPAIVAALLDNEEARVELMRLLNEPLDA